MTNFIFNFQGELDWEDEAAVVSNLTMLAIFGIEDPVRPEVSNRIVRSFCKKLVIRISSLESLKC